MVRFEASIGAPFDGAFVEDPALSWIARGASKPGRPPTETWIVNGDHAWSVAHLEEPAERIADSLASSFFEALAVDPVTPRVQIAHRWRYALVERPIGAPCLFDDERRLGACGDWCLGPRVEAAFLSGAAAAGRVLGSSPDRHCAG